MPEPHSASPTIGLLVENLSNSRFVDAWRGAWDELRRHGVSLRCFCVGSIQDEQFTTSNSQRALCRLIDPHSVAGLLTFQWWRDKSWFEHICLPYQPVPIVNIMRHFEGYPGVRIDNEQGIRQQLHHLIDVHGYRKIAYMIGADTPSGQERYQAYRKVLQEYRIPVDPALVIPCLDDDMLGLRDIRQHGHRGVNILLHERNLQPGRDIDAIATFNDTMALGVIEELQRLRIHVPHDIAVVGFDNLEGTDVNSVPVTTVAIPWYDLGKQAAAMLRRRLASGTPPVHELVLPTLIVRRSCGCREPQIQYIRREFARSSALPQSRPQERLDLKFSDTIISHVESVMPAARRWCAQLEDAFLAECAPEVERDGDCETFLHLFEQGLSRIEQAGANVDVGHAVISSIVRAVQWQQRQYPGTWPRAERLCHEARILMHAFAQRVQQRKHAEAGKRASVLRGIGQRLLATFDLAGLMDALAEELPRLGIRSCYLAHYTESGNPAEHARMLLAYSEQGRALFAGSPYVFPASQLVPDELLPHASCRNLVVEALIFGSVQLGFVVFDGGSEDTALYAILRGEISSALQGALLVREIRERDERLEELVEERTAQLRLINERLHQSIEQQTLAEQALRSSEQQYRLLAENVDDGIVIAQHGRIVFTNAVLATMLGAPIESLLNADPVPLLHITAVENASRDRRGDQQRRPAETMWQTQIAVADGRTLWTEIGQAPMVWNSQPALLLTVRDITHRKLKELRLEEERSRLHQENITLRSNIKERFRFGPLVGKSLVMQQVYETIMNAAASDVNVLILGESGTGKELIARTVHQLSVRHDNAFVAVNCASIPETLFEREFFGHHRGAFTGADRDHPGLFDRAHRGVLFLDEVTELTPGAQAKLLRVLQDGEYTPLGSNAPKKADVLIVAATNKDPHTEIAHGHLRQDFFYRIGVIEINIPPLRERKDDLPLLLEHILEGCRQKHIALHGNLPTDMAADVSLLPAELVQAMYAYHWPGNVRELQNIAQRYLAGRDLRAVLKLLGKTLSSRTAAPFAPTPSEGLQLPDAIRAVEKQIITDALRRTRHNVAKTAKLLGISRGSLYRKMQQCGLNQDE